MQDVATERFKCFVFPVPFPLQLADSSAGEVVFELLRRMGDITGLEALRDLFPLNIDATSSDAGSGTNVVRQVGK